MTKKCVEKCPEELNLDGAVTEGICKTCAVATSSARTLFNPMNMTCVDTCPDEKNADENGVCPTCEKAHESDENKKGNIYFNQGDNKCVVKCDQTFNENKVCETCKVKASKATVDADKLLKFWDPLAEKCASSCLSGDDGSENDICKTCAEIPNNNGKNFWTGEICDTKCPSDKPVFETKKICAEKCSTESDYWDPMAERCIGTCPTDTISRVPTSGKICKTCREAATADKKTTYYYDANKDGGKCVAKCETGVYTYIEND